MAFGLDDATAAITKEIIEEGLKEGGDALKEYLPDVSFESSDFQNSPLDYTGHEINPSDISKSDFVTPENIGEEFTPYKFNNLGETENSTSQIETVTTETIEHSSTFEEQTIDNFTLEEMRPEVEEGMTLGYEHDGGVLRKNMEQAMNRDSNPEESNAHHIVGRDTPQAAKELERLGIDRNDPANGIFLPNSPESSLKGAVHGQGRHTADYSNEVEQRFAGVITREEALEVLQSLKEDLYNGNLSVHYDTPANKQTV